MKKFDQFKNKLYSKLPTIFFVLLFIILLLVAMNKGKIDNFFGFPDVNLRIDNKESYLLDYFIKYQDFGKHWKIEEVNVIHYEESQGSYSSLLLLSIKGLINESEFALRQYFESLTSTSEYIDFVNSRVLKGYTDSEKAKYEELYISTTQSETAISIYCYLIDRQDEENHLQTSCSILLIDENILSNVELTVDKQLTKQEAVQITDELKSMMQNTKS